MKHKSIDIKPFRRKVDSVGRVSIPPIVFEALDILEGANVIMHLEPETDSIRLKIRNKNCVLCDSKESVYLNEHNFYICSNCRTAENLVKLVEHRYEPQMIRSGRRLVLPIKLRKMLDISIGDYVEITYSNKELQIIKVENTDEQV